MTHIWYLMAQSWVFITHSQGFHGSKLGSWGHWIIIILRGIMAHSWSFTSSSSLEIVTFQSLWSPLHHLLLRWVDLPAFVCYHATGTLLYLDHPIPSMETSVITPDSIQWSRNPASWNYFPVVESSVQLVWKIQRLMMMVF